MSAAHKEALARGREEGRIVRQYLEALQTAKPRRGRKRTPDAINKRLAFLESEMPYVDALTHLRYLQESADLEAQLISAEQSADITSLEKAFVKVARSYGERKGLSYSTWRSAGVRAEVLRSAGIARTRG